jgi:hypothetical protein
MNTQENKNEFSGRIAAQRRLLQIVNQRQWSREQLFGLSKLAIERWVTTNQLDTNARLVRLVFETSERLFFLANKSQEQISTEYGAMMQEVNSLISEIAVQLSPG